MREREPNDIVIVGRLLLYWYPIISYMAKILKKVKKTKFFNKKNLPKVEEKPLGRKIKKMN